MTGNVNYVRHLYKVERERRQYTVFELSECTGNPVLTKLIRIENDRHYHFGKGFNQWLRMRTTNNWSKCKVTTGLKYTKYKTIFFGDIILNRCKNLLMFKYSSDGKQLTVDFYPFFYPSEKELNAILKEYK